MATAGTESSGTLTQVRDILHRLPPTTVWRTGERVVESSLFVAAGLSIFVTVAITLILLANTVVFFGEVPPSDFFLGTRWSPVTHGLFGFLPLLSGTLLVTAGAAVFGLPVGLAAALYMYEYAPLRVRAVLKPTLELLAGVPTVVYGFFAILIVAPALRDLFGADFFNAMNGILMIGIMVIPMVSSLSEDALSAVPRTLRDGALAMGATRFEALTRVVLPASLSGILASFILAVSRAIGETMIVTMATGLSPKITVDPFRSIEAITTEIATRSLGDLPIGAIAYQSIFALGVVLFLITLAMNALSGYMLARFREAYT